MHIKSRDFCSGMFFCENCGRISGKVIKVVSHEEEKDTLTEADSEMDARAIEAVKAAYVEYANGERKSAGIPMRMIFSRKQFVSGIFLFQFPKPSVECNLLQYML